MKAMHVSNVIQTGKNKSAAELKKCYSILTVLFALAGVSVCEAQQSSGTVSYVTARSVYVAFENTEGIKQGDTLMRQQGRSLIPCLVVDNKSSASCVTHSIAGCELKKGDRLLHRASPNAIAKTEEPEAFQSKRDSTARIERYRGRVSAASYSTLSNIRTDNHRAMYRLSFNADNIRGSRLSAETYINYRQLFLEPGQDSLLRTNIFNVYNLALKYEASPTLRVTLGRKINSKVASLGAIDGLQAEKSFGNLYTGAIVGFRPDILDFGFNADLLQYGAYMGWSQKGKKVHSRTTLGALQQTNAGAVDRRYLYFQHSSSIGRKMRVFSSAELDLFNQVAGQSAGGPRLTNLFTSVNYRFNRAWNLMVSYDSRKRVVFYETFRTLAETLLADDDARQGVRARLNIKPMRYTHLGLSYSKRFQSNSQNASDNMNIYLGISRLPGIRGRASLTLNQNESDYLRSRIASLRHSRNLFRDKLRADFYIRWIEYNFITSTAFENGAEISRQHYFGTGLTWRIVRSLSLSVLGEYSTRAGEQTYRLNTRLIKRFDTKRR